MILDYCLNFVGTIWLGKLFQDVGQLLECWLRRGIKELVLQGRATLYANSGVWMKIPFLFSCLVMLMRGTAKSRLEWCLDCLTAPYARMLRYYFVMQCLIFYFKQLVLLLSSKITSLSVYAGCWFFFERVFIQSNCEDRYFNWLWSLQREKEGWNGLYFSHK